jgi:hypothetical protein
MWTGKVPAGENLIKNRRSSSSTYLRLRLCRAGRWMPANSSAVVVFLSLRSWPAVSVEGGRNWHLAEIAKEIPSYSALESGFPAVDFKESYWIFTRANPIWDSCRMSEL